MGLLFRRLVCVSSAWASVGILGACGNGTQAAEPESPTADERGEPPHACQFDGNVQCTVTEELPLDAVSRLGFSASEVLPTMVGKYEIPIAWVTPCKEATACSRGSDCSRFDEQPPVSVEGTTTSVRVEITALGPASVSAPGPEQDACGHFMQIPASLSVRTADGALDMTRDIPIWTECGNELSVELVGPAAELGGTLGAELGDEVVSNLRFVATYDELVYLRLYFIRQVEDAPRPVSLVADMLLGARTCQQYVAREDVLVAE